MIQASPMRRAVGFSVLSSLALGIGILHTPPAIAQVCPYATIELDTAQSVDVSSICEAAQPWSEKGFRVLVYLTDEQPASEDAWFARLDQVEANAGLRDLNEADSFALDGLSFAAVTQSNAFWNPTLTYGENLYNRPLDTSPQVDVIKQDVQAFLQTGQATEGMATFLSATYDLNYAPNPLIPGAIALFSIGGLGATVGAIVQRRRTQHRLEAHLSNLQGLVANLLMAGEQLLSGSDPTEMASYQVFVAANGELYPEMAAQLKSWLRDCRHVLDEAFQIYQTLQNQPTSQALKQRVAAWERLYLALVGTQNRIRNLSNDELLDLLNPMQLVQFSGNDSLTEQITTLRKDLEGRPLRIQLEQVKPDDTEIEGLLGHLDKIEALIRRVQTAPDLAPQAFAKLQTRRSHLVTILPTTPLNRDRVLAYIDQQMQQAEQALQEQRFLTVLDQCDTCCDAIQAIEEFMQAIAYKEQCDQDVDALMSQGYRFSQLTEYEQAIATLLHTLCHQVETGQGVTSNDLEQLKQQCYAMLKRLQDNVYAHQQVERELAQFPKRIQQIANQILMYRADILPDIQRYSTSRYQMAQQKLDAAKAELATVEGAIATIEHLNSMKVQEFEQAYQQFETLQSRLNHINQTLHEIERERSTARSEYEWRQQEAHHAASQSYHNSSSFSSSHHSSSHHSQSSSRSSGPSKSRSSSSSGRSSGSKMGGSFKKQGGGGSHRSSGGSSKRSGGGGGSSRRR
jgi:hypothetical protein